MRAFYNYSEPFSAECRAFGRLQEMDRQELAVRCFGYVLLDEEHERAMLAQFAGDLNYWHFNGGGDDWGYDKDFDARLRFVGKDGRPPPLRCIVKAFGQAIQIEEEASFREVMARRLLRDIIRLQKLGIIEIDVGIQQLIDGKIGDFSTAITMPHFITNPELNPNIAQPAMIEAMSKATFEHCVNDFINFDDMIAGWNRVYGEGEAKGCMTIQANPGVWVYPGGRIPRYNLRSHTAANKRPSTLVDPRRYGWIASPADRGTSQVATSKVQQSGRISKTIKRKGSMGSGMKSRLRQLTGRPDMWHYDYEESDQRWAELVGSCFDENSHSLFWSYKDGYIIPVCMSQGGTWKTFDSPPIETNPWELRRRDRPLEIKTPPRSAAVQ